MRLLLALILVLSLPSFAVVESYQFDNDNQRMRYNQWIDELRCPKCQNQNLSGSNSPIAKDLRREVYRLINENQSDTKIKDFMVKRYGNFVLYEPPVDAKTYVLWFSPIVLLLLGFILLVFLKRQQTSIVADKKQALTQDEQQHLQAVLNKYQ